MGGRGWLQKPCSLPELHAVAKTEPQELAVVRKKKTLKIPEPRNDIIGARYEFQVMYSKSATRDAIVAVSVKHVPE